MSVEDQFRSLTLELKALKDRVRNFRQTNHWLTDGEWKELVLRTVLQRHFPRHIEALRGFVIEGETSTKQIDVLIYDNSKPCLFRAGDLVFVTPDAVPGIVEVKSTIADAARLSEALEPLAENVSKIRKGGSPEAFAGLFAFDTNLEDYAGLKTVLTRLQAAALDDKSRVIDFVCLGGSLFILFWKSPSDPPEAPERWQAYVLGDMAPGYFVNNLVYAVANESVQQSMRAWFPERPKGEVGLEGPGTDLGYGRINSGSKAPGL